MREWQGEVHGRIGWFPFNYVQVLAPGGARAPGGDGGGGVGGGGGGGGRKLHSIFLFLIYLLMYSSYLFLSFFLLVKKPDRTVTMPDSHSKFGAGNGQPSYRLATRQELIPPRRSSAMP